MMDSPQHSELDSIPHDENSPPPLPPSSRPRKPARNPVCRVLPKKWEQHADPHTVEQVQRAQQQRPTLYKCLTCQLGFTKVNDLLTHCAQIHAPEPRLEIAIDYNKAADQRQGEALMDFIRVPERSSEMGSEPLMNGGVNGGGVNGGAHPLAGQPDRNMNGYGPNGQYNQNTHQNGNQHGNQNGNYNGNQQYSPNHSNHSPGSRKQQPPIPSRTRGEPVYNQNQNSPANHTYEPQDNNKPRLPAAMPRRPTHPTQENHTYRTNNKNNKNNHIPTHPTQNSHSHQEQHHYRPDSAVSDQYDTDREFQGPPPVLPRGATCPSVASEITSTNCSNHLSPFPPIQRKASDESDTSNKPSFVCDVCGKAFKRSRERQKHMLLHGMSTDLRCHDCQMDFTWEWTLNIHLQEKHGLPPRESNMTHDITPKSVRDRQAAKQVKERADAAAAVALHQLNLANQLAEANGGVKLEGLEDEYDIYEDDVAEENSVYDAGFEAAPVGNYNSEQAPPPVPRRGNNAPPARALPLPPKKRRVSATKEEAHVYQDETSMPHNNVYQPIVSETYVSPQIQQPLRQPQAAPPSAKKPRISDSSQKTICPFCHKTLSRKRDLNRHVQNVHLRGNTGTAKQAKLQCPTCQLYFLKSEHLEEHDCQGRPFTLEDLNPEECHRLAEERGLHLPDPPMGMDDNGNQYISPHGHIQNHHNSHQNSPMHHGHHANNAKFEAPDMDQHYYEHDEEIDDDAYYQHGDDEVISDHEMAPPPVPPAPMPRIAPPQITPPQITPPQIPSRR